MAFQHKILSFDPKAIKFINDSIDQHISRRNIADQLKLKFPQYSLPGKASFDRYLSWYQNKEVLRVPLVKDTVETSAIESSSAQPAEIYTFTNKKELLERLLYTVNQRFGNLTDLQNRKFEFKNENILAKYVDTIKELTTTIVELKDELDVDTAQIDAVVQQRLSSVFLLIKTVVYRVCPEKAILFQEELQNEYKKMFPQTNQGDNL